jgi:hypothetical protein
VHTNLQPACLNAKYVGNGWAKCVLYLAAQTVGLTFKAANYVTKIFPEKFMVAKTKVKFTL